MKYVRQEIDSWLFSNITQDYLDYNPLTTYIYEDVAVATSSSVVTYKGYYWRSVTDANTGNNPELTENKYWNRWKVANVNAMLDQKSLTATTVSYIQTDADFISTDTQVDIGLGTLVWDVVDGRMYESLLATNDLPNSDFSDPTLWLNKSDIIVEFERGGIDTLGIGYIETSGITIEHYDSLGALLSDFTQTFTYGVNEGVVDLISYIYEPYSIRIDRSLKIDISPIGYKIRVTIARQLTSGQAACGFMVGGEATDMGKTLDEVGFSFNSFSLSDVDAFGNLTITRRNVQDLVDFETIINKKLIPWARGNIKSIYDEVVLFIVDPSVDSDFEFMLTLGKIQDASTVARQMSKTIIAWSVVESI